jgi:hypothetical protein
MGDVLMVSYQGKKCRDCANVVTASQGWFCEKCRCKSAIQSIHRERLCPMCGEFLYKMFGGTSETRYNKVVCLNCKQIWDLNALNLVCSVAEAKVKHG